MVVSEVDLGLHHVLDLEHLREAGRDHFLGFLKLLGRHRDRGQELHKAEVGRGQNLDLVQGQEVDRNDQGKAKQIII